MSCGASRKERHRVLLHDPHAVECPAVEHHLGEYGKVCRSAKQSGMSSDSAKRPRILVVNFASEWIASRRRDFRWSGARRVFNRQSEVRVVHPQPGKHLVLQKRVEWLTAHCLGDESE